MKKLLAILPIIGLILGAVAIATEIRRPTSLDAQYIQPIPHCQPQASLTPTETPIICAQ